MCVGVGSPLQCAQHKVGIFRQVLNAPDSVKVEVTFGRLILFNTATSKICWITTTQPLTQPGVGLGHSRTLYPKGEGGGTHPLHLPLTEASSACNPSR